MQLTTILKMIGVEVTEETLEMLQALIPQLPAKVNEVVTAINLTLQNFDARLNALEQSQLQQNELLHLLVEELRLQNGTGNRLQREPDRILFQTKVSNGT